ncbi:DNA cytosine methyltransferase [Erwinia pyrifoliae]|uniref:DNA cytosine methyltransferase n=1 Tax=Erwinia pyrifoliae TaxID=79967 RepID=UPI0022032994|nr:DNA cytosine methyltransferase [Erwinia pyrifoliae]MCT2386320.1 DNA cytosine methyltransferase [Erwinia pyrifoliae]MCU8588083.1 DNA cytosine methyltransferase [Erwinia pyrifoliae]UWS28480.1 DNA cytosine methyltransferase [Erwinia pyrifoliae]UXK11482.1 DNA cytosine methyltransferase [Erwinia pyrifoliae]
MKVLDLFCGTGGFSHGFELAQLGFETVFGIDVLPVATQTFNANRPNSLSVCSDIRKVRRSELSDKLKLKRGMVDVIVGGPPCQGFSSIRPFRSSNDDDPRNSLFEEYASFVNYFRPPVFVLENVVGLATHKDGSTVALMEACFKNLGYDTQWRILNAANYGVPQKRERLIMIGVERGGKIEFPDTSHNFSGATISVKDKRRVHAPTYDLFTMKEEKLRPAVSVMEAISDLPPIQSGEEAKRYTESPLNEYQKLMRRYVKDELSLHLATAHSKKMLEIIKHSGKNINCIPKGMVTSGFSSCYSRLDANEPAVTITVNFVHPASNRCIHPVQNRALTPREGARLQSFDDAYVFCGNRSQITKQIGNAVPPLLGKAIAGSIAKLF